MSTTHLSPHFKGLEWRAATALEGSLWGVKAEIQELERKFEVADSKTLAHYHE